MLRTAVLATGLLTALATGACQRPGPTAMNTTTTTTRPGGFRDR